MLTTLYMLTKCEAKVLFGGTQQQKCPMQSASANKFSNPAGTSEVVLAQGTGCMIYTH